MTLALYCQVYNFHWDFWYSNFLEEYFSFLIFSCERVFYDFTTVFLKLFILFCKFVMSWPSYFGIKLTEKLQKLCREFPPALNQFPFPLMLSFHSLWCYLSTLLFFDPLFQPSGETNPSKRPNCWNVNF